MFLRQKRAAGHDKFGLGFQITCAGDDAGKYPSPRSLSWAGIFNTEFWVDPSRGIGAVLMMRYLPFYDEAAIRTLRNFETAVYQQLAPRRCDQLAPSAPRSFAASSKPGRALPHPQGS
jgi:CubicO group peptidase (beta-lactamase class C family)